MALIGPMTRRQSTATNVFDFLTDLRRFQLEEPLRVDMGTWVRRGKPLTEFLADENQWRREENEYRQKKLFKLVHKPVCGSVGCAAGNAVMLARLPFKMVDYGVDGISVEEGFTDIAYEFLTRGDEMLRLQLARLFGTTGICATYGTREYAQAVNDLIKDFQENNKAKLKTFKIRPTKTGSRAA